MNNSVIMSLSLAGLIVAGGAAFAGDDADAPRGERGKHREHFAQMDSDGDGKISAAEFEAANHPRMMGVDGNEDGGITEAEAAAHHAERLQHMAERLEAKREQVEERLEEKRERAEEKLARAQERLAEAEEKAASGETRWKEHFSKVDTNGDGTIDEDELAVQKAAHFAEMDTNGDGFLTKREMRKGMREMRDDRGERREHGERGERGDRERRRAPKDDG